MTTLAQARAELVTAIDTAGLRPSVAAGLDPPYVLVSGDGLEVGHLVRGQAVASFRARCIAGAWDDKAAAGVLDEQKLAVLDVLRALAGWRLGDVGGDAIRDYAGAMFLTADLTASRMIDIT